MQLLGLTSIIGKWQGTNHLWLSPEEPVRKSVSFAEINTIAHEQFVEIRYTWADEGKSQEGRLILGQETGRKDVKAVWFDTWHMMNQFMICDEYLILDHRSRSASLPLPVGIFFCYFEIDSEAMLLMLNLGEKILLILGLATVVFCFNLDR